MKLADHTRIISLNKSFSLIKNFYLPSPYLIVTNDIVQLLKINIDSLPLDIKRILKKHNILIKSGTRLKVKFEPSDTLEIWLHVTNSCNFNCAYCYIKKNNKNLEWNTFLSIYKYLLSTLKKQGKNKLKVKFSGGEPLIRFPMIQKMFLYLKENSEKHGIKFKGAILTNGSIYSRDISNFISKNKIDLMISLDGVEEFHDNQRFFKSNKGTFRLVWKNILKYRNDGHDPIISITVTPESVVNLDKLVKILLDNNLRFNYNFIRETEISGILKKYNTEFEESLFIKSLDKTFSIIEKNLPKWSLLNALSDRVLLSSMRDHCCGAGRDYYFIDHLGHIAFCQMMSNDNFGKINRQGELNNIDLKPQFYNPSVDEKKECANCDYKYFCCGGCPLQDYRKNNSFSEKSPYCSIYKNIIPKILKLEGLRVLKYPSESKTLFERT